MTLVYPLDHRHSGSPDEVLALVGSKALQLGLMLGDLGLPVPPGFVITTDACRQVLAGRWPPGLDDEIREAMRVVETRLGRGFGMRRDPLLVSVRSGAPVSMPGMMDTVLDIGVTSATAPGLAAAGGEAFAEDCRRRLRAMFRAVVTAAEPPDNPWSQLRQSIEAVFRSWNSDRARAYRDREGISEDLGTAVTIQAMVFGNLDDRSATGVLFTRNPATGEPTPYGDVVFSAQGEDVVAGTHATEPIAALDGQLPEVAAELRGHAARLERHYADLCDIEFTIESGRLWLLQVRVGKRSPQAALRIAVDMAEDPYFPLTREEAVRRVAPLLERPPVVAVPRPTTVPLLTIGLPASPGVATGELVTDAAAAAAAGAAGRAVILVRAETSPDDVHGMARAAGIVTALGGIASHAAVVARGWGIPAVVGAREIEVRRDGIGVNGQTLPTGEVLTIDGGTGQVFRGAVEAATEAVPEAGILIDWARDLGIAIGAQSSTAARLPAAPDPSREAVITSADDGAAPVDAGECLRLIGLKGFATVDALAAALGCPADAAMAAVDELIAVGAVSESAGAFRLTDAGTARHQALLAAERDELGRERIDGWFDPFLELDGRTKVTVTAWQLREDAGGSGPVVNDHADAAYDALVLQRLAALAEAADEWLGSLEGSAPRFGAYRRRLRGAAQRAVAGDQRFVASPRVDSYHGIWFELHEDLILLADRTRADEVAAGRA
jgi:pyruvate,orthophosphate dikinase